MVGGRVVGRETKSPPAATLGVWGVPLALSPIGPLLAVPKEPEAPSWAQRAQWEAPESKPRGEVLEGS